MSDRANLHTAESIGELILADIADANPSSLYRNLFGEIEDSFVTGWTNSVLADAINLLAAVPPLDSEPLERTRLRLLARFQPKPAEAEA